MIPAMKGLFFFQFLRVANFNLILFKAWRCFATTLLRGFELLLHGGLVFLYFEFKMFRF